LENRSRIQFKIKSSLPYHTRFGPDWCFGLIKLTNFISFRISACCQYFHTKRNQSQLIVDPVSKQTLVQVYYWKSYFEIYFRKVPNIISYHHLRFDATKPGLVFIKEFPSTAEKTIKIIKSQCTLHFEGTPLVLNPKCLAAERAWYLYKHIREHVSDDRKTLLVHNPLFQSRNPLKF